MGNHRIDENGSGGRIRSSISIGNHRAPLERNRLVDDRAYRTASRGFWEARCSATLRAATLAPTSLLRPAWSAGALYSGEPPDSRSQRDSRLDIGEGRPFLERPRGGCPQNRRPNDGCLHQLPPKQWFPI